MGKLKKINFSFLELRLPDDDPVYTLKKVMEDIDYSDLLAQYSNKGKNGFNPIMMYATVVYAAMRGIRSVEPVHLFEELQNIQDYYQIIRFRFFDRISLNIDIKDDSILQTYLPQLTIQPIVENAINHGLKDNRIAHPVELIIQQKKSMALLFPTYITEYSLCLETHMVFTYKAFRAKEQMSASITQLTMPK